MFGKLRHQNSLFPLQIKESDFTVISLLGGDNSSLARVLYTISVLTKQIYKVRKKHSDEYYAMKVIRKDVTVDSGQDLRHPFVVEQKFFFQDEKKIYLIYEYISGGPLNQV